MRQNKSNEELARYLIKIMWEEPHRFPEALYKVALVKLMKRSKNLTDETIKIALQATLQALLDIMDKQVKKM